MSSHRQNNRISRRDWCGMASLGVGVSIASCRSHLLPFDSVEILDANRPGMIRSSCRRCGRFLGFRPVGEPKTLNTVRDVAPQRVNADRFGV